MRLRLSKCDFDVVYKTGMKHKAADTSFLLQKTGKKHTYLEDDLHVLAINKQESGEQHVHIISTQRNEETLLRASEEQALDKSLTEKELVLERKHDD